MPMPWVTKVLSSVARGIGMANVLYDEIFLSTGASIFAYWYIEDPLENAINPPKATYVSWEPLPYYAENYINRSYTYSTP
jgi:hypothetical protein